MFTGSRIALVTSRRSRRTIPRWPFERSFLAATGSSITTCWSPTGRTYASRSARFVRSARSRCTVNGLVSPRNDRRTLCSLASQCREDLFPVKLNALFLLRSDLMNVHVIEAGVGVLLDFLQMRLRIGPANDVLHDVFFPDQLRGRFNLRGKRQLHLDRARYGSGRPVFHGCFPCFLFVTRPAHGHLAEARLRVSAGLLELLDDFLVR